MRRRCTEPCRTLRAALAALALLCAPLPAAAQAPLVLAFIPQENPEKLVGDIREITAYLAGELKREVKGYVTLDHAAAIEALAAAKADISFMGALPSALARSRIGAEVVLSEVYRGKPFYAGAIFVRRDSGLDRIETLRGKVIAFADPISESGYLYPLDIFVRAGLLERGVDPHRFFRRVYFAGGYQQAIQAVANGLVDAAGVSIYSPLLLPPTQQGRRGFDCRIGFRSPRMPSSRDAASTPRSGKRSSLPCSSSTSLSTDICSVMYTIPTAMCARARQTMTKSPRSRGAMDCSDDRRAGFRRRDGPVCARPATSHRSAFVRHSRWPAGGRHWIEWRGQDHASQTHQRVGAPLGGPPRFVRR